MKQPLAFRLRPEKLEDIIGQKHLVAKDEIIYKCIEQKQLFSMIFFGPPGTGKTTLAMVIANELKLPYRLFNAVSGNKKDLDAIFFESKLTNGLVLIIDEVHRLNKDKQDLLLPHIEDGSIILIGATTSNPYFSINPAIRSRCHLLEVKALEKEDIKQAIKRAIIHPSGLNNSVTIDDDAIDAICISSNGDIRYALNLLDILSLASKDHHISKQLVTQYASVANSSINSQDDGHYDAVSAFQKSIRGQDVNAALYYLSYLALANDMDSIERRLLVTAYEDIGLGNPACVARTINAIDTAKRVGFPEALIPLGLQVIDLTLSPKTKSAEEAIHAAYDCAKNNPLPILKYLRLTPVGLAEEDKYDYDRSDIWHKIQYLPNEIKDLEFYKPNTNSAYEAQLAKNYQELKKYHRTTNIKDLKR